MTGTAVTSILIFVVSFVSLVTASSRLVPEISPCEDSVTACSKDSTVEKENGKEIKSVKVKNKKEEEGDKADEMDGQTGQIVVAVKASIIQINKTPKVRERMALEREEWREEKLTKVSNLLMLLQLFWLLFGSLTILPAFFIKVLHFRNELQWDVQCHNIATVWFSFLCLSAQWLLLIFFCLFHAPFIRFENESKIKV